MAPTNETIPYLAAFAAAIAGSLHCAGMCGPLRLLCAPARGARWKYQAGRGFAYGLLGALAGGAGFVLPLWALLALVTVALLASVARLPALPGWSALRRRALAFGSTSPFLLGLSSGLLPCGLLHGWLAAAAATAHPLSGALVLCLLWAGSVPALEVSPLLLRRPLAALQGRFPKALRVGLLLLALLPLGWRLPVKIASPGAEGSQATPVHCHPQSH